MGSLAAADEPPPLALTWEAPAACPSETVVRGQIDQLLAGSTHARGPAPLSVRAVVVHGERWTVTLDTTSGSASGHRSIEASTCEGLASATSLIVALMIDPDAVAAHAKSPTVPAKAPPAPVPPMPAAAPVAALPRSTFALLGLGGAAHVGVLPGADAGLALGLGLAHDPWRAELRLAYFPRQLDSDPLSGVPGAYARFRFFHAALDGCRVALGRRLDFGGCMGAELGVVRGKGVGAQDPSAQTTPWVGLGAGAVMVLKATPWLQFPLHLGAVAPLWRPSFVFYGADHAIFRSAPVGARASLAAEARF